MKKLFKLLLVMFILYFIIQGLFKIFGKGYSMTYSVPLNKTNSVTIEETYVSNTKGEKTNYHWNIKINDQTFSIQTYRHFGYSSKVIKEVRYYQGAYQCIYPIFKGNKQIMDVLCLDQGVLKNYTNLKGKDSGLDAFVAQLINEKLYEDHFQDLTTEKYQSGEMTLYTENVVDGHYLAINSYRGVYTINTRNPRKLYEVKMFDDDIYQRELTALAGLYYISPDDSQDYDFSSLKVVNIKSNEVSSLDFNFNISYNSYIQGVVDDEIYLIDKSNRKQYKINPKKKNIEEIGNESTPSQYYDRGTWSEVSIYDVVNQERYFNTNVYQLEDSSYAKVDKVGNEKSGYLYYYRQAGGQYEVYRANVQSPNQLMYLFTTTDKDLVTYIDDYVYYYNGNTLRVYQDQIGNRSIYTNREYEFNKTLDYYVYQK